MDVTEAEGEKDTWLKTGFSRLTILGILFPVLKNPAGKKIEGKERRKGSLGEIRSFFLFQHYFSRVCFLSLSVPLAPVLNLKCSHGELILRGVCDPLRFTYNEEGKKRGMRNTRTRCLFSILMPSTDAGNLLCFVFEKYSFLQCTANLEK